MLSPIWSADGSLAGLKEALASLPTSVQATFDSPRYGKFVINGHVHHGLDGSLSVGGEEIATPKGVPAKTLQALGEFDARGGDASPEAQIDIAHGDLVRAWFDSEPYGEFSITGIALAGETGDLLIVGGWILARGRRVAEKVTGLDLLTRAGDVVPPRLPPTTAKD